MAGDERKERLPEAEVTQACLRILGREPDEITRPGGSGRKSARVRLDGETLIISRRDTERRAGLEAGVLEALHDNGAPVPRLIGIEGRWLVQQDLGTARLSTALRRADERQAVRLLDGALASLAACHEAGRKAGLADRVYRIGDKPNWLAQLIESPKRLGEFAGLPAPALDVAALEARLAPRQPAFIKWDARPPNAIPYRDGGAGWFDWEHCGCRNALDDLAWFLGDESVPDLPDVETALLRRHLDAFAGGLRPGEALDYLRAFGVLHMTVRLGIIMGDAKKRTDGDGDEDGEGTIPRTAPMLCRRARRWAGESPETAPLAGWFLELGERIQSDGT